MKLKKSEGQTDIYIDLIVKGNIMAIISCKNDVKISIGNKNLHHQNRSMDFLKRVGNRVPMLNKIQHV